MSAFCKGREKKRRKKGKENEKKKKEKRKKEEEKEKGEKKAEVIPRLTRALVICQGASVFARRWNQLL